MSDQPIQMFSQGPPRTILPVEDSSIRDALHLALAADDADRRAAVAAITVDHPRSLVCWSVLGSLGRDTIEQYAAYRVGYHRGLDALRANGWRGSGYVRWADETNRPFLRCLLGLGRLAQQIGETDEADRIGLFLGQLDPTGIPAGE